MNKAEMRPNSDDILEIPIYGLVDAAHYLRVPYNTLRYWVLGRNTIQPIIRPAGRDPWRLSFMNLMECHMLSAMRTYYDLHLPKVRKALDTLTAMFPSPHPLIDRRLETDKADIFVRKYNELISLTQPGQLGFREMLEVHLQRIQPNVDGIPAFFPFVEKRSADEPKLIMITPAISFGRPVITGTGITTAVIASRFHARESISDLAREYGRTDKEIEEAVRWESRTALAA